MSASSGGSWRRRGEDDDDENPDEGEISGTISFWLPADAPVHVTDVLPGVPFELLVHDEYGGIVHGPDTLTLAPGEWRTLRLVIAAEPRDLVVNVRDPQGKPLRASASVDQMGGSLAWFPSDDGVLLVPHLQGHGVSLLVRSTGYVDRTLDDPVAPADGAPIIVVMQPARMVSVHIGDAGGRDVPASHIEVRTADGRETGRVQLDEPTALAVLPDASIDREVPRTEGDDSLLPPEDRSRWRLVELPPEEVTVVAVVGGETYRQSCAADRTHIEVVVAEIGAAKVRWDVAIEPRAQASLEFRRVVSGKRRVVRQFPDRAALEAHEFLVPALLPGDYEVRLVTDENGIHVLRAGPATVTVSAGVTAEVTLALP